MLEESKNKKYIVVNNIKVFVGLPVISKKTMTIENKELITMKEDEDFVIITKQELNDETKVKKDEIVVETKYEYE